MEVQEPQPCVLRLVPDIIDLICSEVDQFPSDPRFTLNALARTCRLFHESAMNHLWYELHSLAPLIMCMPEDLWRIVPAEQWNLPNLSLCREIVPTDWPRFLVRAARVRKLNDRRYSWLPDISRKTVAEVLKAAPPAEILLPNIRSLQCAFTDEHFPYINTLLGPHIQSLDLSIECDNEALRSFLSHRHLDSLWHAKISSYRMWDLDRPLSFQQVDLISRTICHWTQLRTLSVEELTSAALTYIAAFPDLHHLVLKDPKPEAVVFPVLAFPALRSLDIECNDMQFCIDVVEALSLLSSCLSDVKFIFKKPSSGSRWKHLIDPLASTHTFHTSLRTINIGYHWMSRIIMDPGKDILSSLFVFSNLTSFCLRLRGKLDIDDNFMETMSKAWPRLRSFHLSGESAVTLLGLVPLAKFCLELEELGITFDARVAGASSEDYDSKHWAGVRNTNFLTLEVNQSPIDNPRLVINVLWDIFPNISLSYATNGREILPFEADWLEVARGLQERQLLQDTST